MRLFLIVGLLFFSSNVLAESQPDKSQYTLFNPTPTDKLRGWSTDRPDKTESAYTIDAGHFSEETDILNFTQDSSEGSSSSSLLVASPNLKVGLTNTTDLQLIVAPLVYNHSNHLSLNKSGLGDTLVRVKQNIWGNDGGQTAFGAMPFIKFPTSSRGLGNDAVEGGLILPFAWREWEDFGIGAMTEFDVLRKDDDSGNYMQFINSITFDEDLSESIGIYGEIWSAASDQIGHQVTLDFGVTYLACEDLQFDIGINAGATDTADDLNYFVGISQRF